MSTIHTSRSAVSFFNENILYASLASSMAFLCVIVYKIVHILNKSIINTIISIKYLSNKNRLENVISDYTRKDFIAKSLNFIFYFVSIILELFFSLFRTTLYVLYILFPLVIFSILLIIIEQSWNEILKQIINVFNESIGPNIRAILYFPLQALKIAGTNTIPMFNLLVFIFIQTPLEMLFNVFVSVDSQNDNIGGAYHMFQMISNVAELFPVLFNEINQFSNKNKLQSCEMNVVFENKYNNNSISIIKEYNDNLKICTNDTIFLCTYLTSTQIAEVCLDYKYRMINLEKTVHSVKMIFGHAIMAIGSSCKAVALIANTTLYPLIDHHTWNASSLVLNSILHTVVVAPISAYQRCKLVPGGFNQRPSMCTPDMGPSFDMLGNACEEVGKMITNWLNIIYLFIVKFSPEQIQSVCASLSSKENTQSMFNDDVQLSMFKNNVTVLVKMSKNSFSFTDGRSSVFIEEKYGYKKTYAPNIWSTYVNPSFGIARVLLPTGVNMNDNGIGLFGCDCNDGSDGKMYMQCTTITKSGNSWTFPVQWSLSSEVEILKCSRIRIVIQSIKRHHKRIVPSLFAPNQGDKYHSTKMIAADAAIYVIPICGSQNGLYSTSCFEEKYYTKGICFPYCMALKLTHESFQPVVMRGYEEWKQGILMTQRNCVLSSEIFLSLGNNQLNSSLSSNILSLETKCSMDTSSSQTPNQVIVNDNTIEVKKNYNPSSNENQICYYDSTCTSLLYQKKNTTYEVEKQFLIPVADTVKGGSKLVLNGQPLVVAGNVIMRMFQLPNGNHMVDFPTLVGNQYSEFAMEYYSYSGIPVSTLSTTPSTSRNYMTNSPQKLKGKIFAPVEYVQTKIPYNPATISVDALWYATNPSYDWAVAFINYCSSQGKFTQLQIMITSSYAPITIWKVKYQSDLSCMNDRSNPDVRICSDDVSESFSIEKNLDFPSFDSQNNNNNNQGEVMYNMCVSQTEFNLWVESLEDFDEYNIAIAVRRGKISDMGPLLNNQNGPKKENGRTVFYFLFKYNSTKIRENIPWSTSDFIQDMKEETEYKEIKIGCPESFTMLPPIGDFIGNSLAAVVYMFKMPINLLLNPFAMNELLNAKFQKSCPENDLKHSALYDCGMNLFSMKMFFDYVYTASHIFWDIVNWIIQMIFEVSGLNSSILSESKELTSFKSFIEGAEIIGDASKIVVMFDIVNSIDVLSLESSHKEIFGENGRRRSLLSYSKMITGGIKKGSSSMMSLSKSIFSAFTAAPFAGADLSITLATSDPKLYIIGSSISAPSIAWVQVTYESLLPIALDTLSNLLHRKITLQPLWVHLHQARDLYHEIIHKRHYQACGGLRLMFGYSTNFGRGIYYNCLAATSIMDGTVEMALTLFVDIPLYRCMCVNAAGQDYVQFVYEKCEYLLPSSYKNKWKTFMYNAYNSENMNEQCELYFASIETKMYTALDPWKQNSLMAIENLGSALNEMISADNRKCNDIESNPSATLLYPLPLHHFRVCAKTTTCKDKCDDTLKAFYNRYQNVYQSNSSSLAVNVMIPVNIESPMFNKFTTDGSQNMEKNTKIIKAFKTHSMKDLQSNLPHPCNEKCNPGSNGYCVSLLLEGGTITDLKKVFSVEYFCIPSSDVILGSVFNTMNQPVQFTDIGTFLKKEGVTDTQSITHWEFSIHNNSKYILMYTQNVISSYNVQGISKNKDLQQIFVINMDDKTSSNSPKKIIHTNEIESKFLTANIQESLFGTIVINPIISDCTILEVIEIHSEINDHLHFFISFRIQIKTTQIESDATGNVAEQKIKTNQKGYRIHMTLDWCDETLDITCQRQMNFHIPCNDVCNGLESACISSCNQGLDSVISMAQGGILHHIEENIYLYIPSYNVLSDTLDSYDLSYSRFQSKVVKINTFSGMTDINNDMKWKNKNLNFKLSESIQNLNTIGSSTRSQIFSNAFSFSFTNGNSIRENRVYYMSNYETSSSRRYPVMLFQVNNLNDLSGNPYMSGMGSSDWLKQIRMQLDSTGWNFKIYDSQLHNSSLSMNINCSINSCWGCGDTTLRLLCHSVQDCTMTRCIGTIIQTQNVLCGIGGFFEHTSQHVLVSWNAIYMSIVEIILIISKQLNTDQTTKRIMLKFPTEQFYNLICTCKDMYGKNIGLGVSVIETISSNIFQGQMFSGSGLDLTGKQDIGILMGEQTLKTTSIANLFYNLLLGSTLVPTMALHKFLVCFANASLMKEEEGSISIEFKDISMDKSWLPCARLNGISKMLDDVDVPQSAENAIETFISFTMSLLSGIGETVMYAMQLSFESIIDFLISIVWNIQEILNVFNIKKCKVPTYATRYVLWCSCNDTAYRIPEKNQKDSDFAFWCVGTMSVNLMDGTQNAIIYNPYTMAELKRGVSFITDYIECISLKGSSNEYCTSILQKGNQMSSLDKLIRQGVEPIVVWAKCKSNYLQKKWDVGSGAMFYDTTTNAESENAYNPFYQSKIAFESILSNNQRMDRIESARQKIGNTFVECMKDTQKLQMDYSSCMRMFFDKVSKQTPDAYFVYEKQNENTQTEIPDACLVFSGMNTTSTFGSEFQQIMHHCMLQDGVSESHRCTLNPSIWSNQNPQKISVAKLHGTLSPYLTSLTGGNPILKISDPSIYALYKAANETLKNEYKIFQKSFESELLDINAMLFSADGDFLHEFIDCMFLGPYNRLEFIPCDKKNNLNCPHYSRDENGGKSREFTPCFGDVMKNDFQLPFTCGSPLRRSIIKYFYRNYSQITNMQGDGSLSKNMSLKILQKVSEIVNNYTSDNSKGCYDPVSNQCSIQNCNGSQNGYSPCMDTNYEISESEIAEYVINNILEELNKFYEEEVYQDTIALSHYYSSEQGKPFQWKNSIDALELSMFDPNEFIVKYDSSETYTMPISKNEIKEKRVKGSLWGMCMNLISQIAMSIPLEKNTLYPSQDLFEMPIGAWKKVESLLLLKRENFVLNVSFIESIVRDIVDASINSHSPFVWHASKRHAPSKSSFCKSSQVVSEPHPPGILSIGPVSIYFPYDNYETPHEFRKAEENMEMHLYGFIQNTIATSSTSCVCSVDHEQSSELCQMKKESCYDIMNVSAQDTTNDCIHMLKFICSTAHQTYYKTNQRHDILQCLMSPSLSSSRIIRCPEMKPSDIWGFYPNDCSVGECDKSSNWITKGNEKNYIVYEGTRFINEGRGGLKLPNYKHIFDTYHHQVNYQNKKFKPEEYMIPHCYDVNQLVNGENKDMETDFSVESADSFINHLFPAAQFLFESPSVAVCSRYIIEYARWFVLNKNIALDAEILKSAEIRANSWKIKCENKIRHLSFCNSMGVYFDMTPSEFSQSLCKVFEIERNIQNRYYLTPNCIIVDKVSKKFYDANVCYKDEITDSTIKITSEKVKESCALIPQPLSMLYDEIHGMPYSMLYGPDGKRMLPEEYWIQEMSTKFDMSTLFTSSYTSNSVERQHINYILDWWPDLIAKEGHHITSSIVEDEFAPITFDSHYIYERETTSFYYVHSALRNVSLIKDVMGAAGICRTNTIGMYMFDMNTNRYCTRMAKKSHEDSPTYPVEIPKLEREEWPFSNKILDDNFEEEFCAEKSTDLPWSPSLIENIEGKKDVNSLSSGSIPGWDLFMKMDLQGKTYYYDNQFSNHFPPSTVQLHNLYLNENENENKWGSTCKLKWKPAPNCNTKLNNNNNQCPDDSMCLPILNKTNEDGVCFSTRAYRESIIISSSSSQTPKNIRQPCFETFHCNDNEVCLTDGGCSPLYLHFWNPSDSKENIEFTVLADDCGFEKSNHPFTQNTRGATPWERVPDLLHVHGFCSHRNWFSYRHSIKSKLCEMNTYTDAMNCKVNETSWPWIHETFNRKKISSSLNTKKQTMAEEKLLLTKSHPCDQQFMHLMNPNLLNDDSAENKRLKVCSGFQGEQFSSNPTAYYTYKLSQSENWDQISFFSNYFDSNTTTQSQGKSSQWLRTYKESTEEIQIGIIEDGIENDNPLGFLGGNVLNDGITGTMATNPNNVRFFRCENENICTKAPHTYNGINVDRINTYSKNVTEYSLRKCGAIGFIFSVNSNNLDVQDYELCVLDMVSFPLVSFILWGVGEFQQCNSLWKGENFDSVFTLSDQEVNSINFFTSKRDMFICEKNPTRNHNCYYSSRLSNQFSEMTFDSSDHVQFLTNELNNLLIAFDNNIKKALKSETEIYEDINICTVIFMEYLIKSQKEIQNMYNSQGPSGLYFSLKFSLYEFPISFFQHLMYISLLQKTYPKFSVIENWNIKNVWYSQNSKVPLWDNAEKIVICENSNLLSTSPFLLTMICSGNHPTYTFSVSEYNERKILIQNVISSVQRDIQSQFINSNQQFNIWCHKKVSWDCNSLTDIQDYKKCSEAREFAHQTNICNNFINEPQHIKNSEFAPWMYPCKEVFKLSYSDLQPISLSQVESIMSENLESIVALPLIRSFETYLQSVQNVLLNTAESIMFPLNYISLNSEDVFFINNDESSSSRYVSTIRLFSLSSMYKEVSSNLNLTKWLVEDVCSAKFSPTDVCVKQEDQLTQTDTEICLFNGEFNELDFLKYTQDDEIFSSVDTEEEDSVIVVHYANGEKEKIPICDLDPEKETCFVQKKSIMMSMSLDQGSSNILPCGISEIDIPAGIEIKTYGLSLTDEEWYNYNETMNSMDACSLAAENSKFNSNQIYSCNWNSVEEKDMWWYYNNVNHGNLQSNPVVEIEKRSKSMKFNFDDLPEWWKNNQDEWNRNGCKKFNSGICSFKVRFENIPGKSKAMCGTDGIPNCVREMANYQSSVYSTTKFPYNDFSRKLYRCAPCTKLKNTISNDGLFKCFISGSSQNIQSTNRSIGEFLTKNSISSFTSYTENGVDFKKKWNKLVRSKFWQYNQTSSLEVQAPLISTEKNPLYELSLSKWEMLSTKVSSSNSNNIENNPEELKCQPNAPSSCWKGIDMKYTTFKDDEIWKKMRLNPVSTSTMSCPSNPYSEKHTKICNPQTDTRRKKLSSYVDNQYRKKNGVWLQNVNTGFGTMWQANVAHPKVGMFTLMYTSLSRPIKDVTINWALSENPCNPDVTVLQDRICVSSIAEGNLFETLHPWTGGDFNPFEGSRGLDECNMEQLLDGSQTSKYMCPCQCEPFDICESTLTNYSKNYMMKEFYSHPSCQNMKFPSTQVMNKNDESNLCSFVQKSNIYKNSECLHRQGLLGGVNVKKSISNDELHSYHGVPTSIENFLVQSMFDLNNNGLWTGSTLMEEMKNSNQMYGFLKMPRRFVHPAHIAFSIDTSRSDWPLVMKGIAMLHYINPPSPIIAGLHNLQWLKKLNTNIVYDTDQAPQIYSQLKSDVQNKRHWSCPLRFFSFWGKSQDVTFSPLNPNPLFYNLVYPEYKGAHPTVKLTSLRSKMGGYKTMNGVCFYEESSNMRIPLNDFVNPCGIKRIIQNLESNTFAVSKVVQHFSTRCNEILEHPNINSELRSHPNEKIENEKNQTCGLLQRLTPFVMKQKGNSESIKKSHTLTTSSEGGDCHMGRSITYSVGNILNDIVGRQCYLFEKNQTHAKSNCPISQNGKPVTLFMERVQKLSTNDLINLLIKRRKPRNYIQHINYLDKIKFPPNFFGPSQIKLELPEISFGYAFTPSLIQILSHDLKYQCKQKNCTIKTDNNQWMGLNFANLYAINKSQELQNGFTKDNNNEIVNNHLNKLHIHESNEYYEEARSKDHQLWNESKNQWTWSLQKYSSNASYTRTFFGTVNKLLWKKNRFSACNASFHEYFEKEMRKISLQRSSGDNQGNEMYNEGNVKNIPLCEPAPTRSLQRLCKALLQYKKDVSIINCQLTGNGECLYNPGMFYLPYMWSSINQEFSAETVRKYYEEIAYTFNSSDDFKYKLCPAKSNLMEKMIELSKSTAQQCPGSQIDYLKDALEEIKKILFKIIVFLYSCVMLIVSLITAVLSKSEQMIEIAMSSSVTFINNIINIVAELLFPVLDAVVSLIFGNSAAGNGFKEVLTALCEFFNNVVLKFWAENWCKSLRPSLYVLFSFLKGVAGFFNSEAGDSIESIWVSIAGGDSGGFDVQSCLAGFVKLKCGPNYQSKKVNTTDYIFQPTATRCWVDSFTTSSGYGIFSGLYDNDYLTCTESDTCTLDNTNIDSYNFMYNMYDNQDTSNLIACASCPFNPKDNSPNIKRYGCNSYLKRCSCGGRGITTQYPSQCLSNSDCKQNEMTTCSIANSVDTARNSISSLPCKMCLDLGTEPVCIMDDSSNQYGICTCVSLFKSDSLQKCDSQKMIGKQVSLIRSAQSMCFISVDPLIEEYSSPSLYVDFNKLAMGPCALGISNNFCLLVKLPIASSGSVSEYSSAYIVINQILPSLNSLQIQFQQGNSRRLLFSENHMEPGSTFWLRKMEILKERDLACFQMLYNESNYMQKIHRNDMKQCIHRAVVILELESIFNSSFVSEMVKKTSQNMIISNQYARIFMYLIKENATDLYFKGQTSSWMMLNSLWSPLSLYLSHIQPDMDEIFKALYNSTVLPFISSTSHNHSDINSTTKNSTQRRLLQINIPFEKITQTLLPETSCKVFETPIAKIASAFQETILFYSSKKTHQTMENTTTTTEKQFSSNSKYQKWWKYNVFVHEENASNNNNMRYSSVNSILRWLQVPGTNLSVQTMLNSLVKDIPYNESVQHNVFNGKRILKEMSTCNYTLLTHGYQPNNNYDPSLQFEQQNVTLWGIYLFIVFYLCTSILCPNSNILSAVVWIVIFPATFMWVAYDTSPLCWPMIPPRLAHDVSTELLNFIPDYIQVPYFLIYEDCLKDSNTHMKDMIKGNECFKQCSSDPFYMTSWQDPLAWWVCESSDLLCKFTIENAKRWNVLQDLASSAEYFSDVQKQKNIDYDFFQAHRFCATIYSYEIVFALFIFLIAILIIPSCIECIFKFFSGAMILILHAVNADSIENKKSETLEKEE